ncbi:MAG TPA: exodeoxyribonuclease VII large subunit [Patescibacteria group bacterium]|nr:exodeoxyribonuclease VII large subunit [Patescibacteria group bacterium]
MSILNVSDVTRYIKELFSEDPVLASAFVRGEISNFKRHSSGHCYFTLKDPGATLRSVMFKGNARYLKFEPRDGMKVIAGGYISVFERDGQYQLYVSQLVPDGVGELGLAFAQLKEKLAAEGLFDPDRKRSLPAMPQQLGIITSLTGAALRDIMTVSKRRHPGLQLVVYPVQVQGAEAPGQIVKAIHAFNALQQADVLIVGRGGGSIEELWAFNDEQVVRAVATSKIPVVSAVGHETDYTLTDFAADCRAATPSQAAELVTPNLKELDGRIRNLQETLGYRVRQLVRHKKLQHDRLRDSAALERPRNLLASRQQLVDQYIQRLQDAVRRLHVSRRQGLQLMGEKLSLLNPWAVLSRGYSIVRTAEQQSVMDASLVSTGQEIEIIPCRGRIYARVTETKGGLPYESGQ